MKTTIPAHHLASSIDLSDIGDLIKEFCNKVNELEEQLEEKDKQLEELEEQIVEADSYKW